RHGNLSGDPMSDSPVPIAELLAHRPWVRTLVRALVAGEADADDLEQDLWLAAIERPPRHDGSLKGWLHRVVRRRAAMSRRATYRREVREHAHATSKEEHEPADIVAQA